MSSGSGDPGAVPNRLGDYWDVLVSGQPPPSRAADLDPALVDTVHRVRALDPARPPTPAFVAELERALMETVGQPIPSSPTERVRLGRSRSAQTRPGADARSSRPLLGGLRRPRPFPHLATAALLLLTLGGILVAFGGGFGSDAMPIMVGSPTVAASASGDVPGPEECRISPRASVAILALDASPAAGEVLEARTVPSLSGTPADETTTVAVTASVREWAACWNAGDPSRWLSLFSDDHLRRLVAYGTVFQLGDRPPVKLPEFLEGAPAPLAPSARFPVPIVRDVRRLSDDRVSAIIEPRPGSDDGEAGASVFVFVRDGDRFLIDDVRPVIEPGTPTFVRPGGEAAVGQPVAFLSEAPNLSAPAVRLREGAILRILGEQVEEEDVAWWPVEDATTGQTGYVLVTSLVPRPVATPGPVDQTEIFVSIAVDAEGVLVEEPAALAAVRTALHGALDRYDGRCRAAVARVLGPANAAPIGYLGGTRLSETIAQELDREFPDLFAGTTFETSVADGTPLDRVDLRLFFFEGCAPIGPAATTEPRIG